MVQQDRIDRLLEVLLTDYKERCTDQRAKSTHYAALWTGYFTGATALVAIGLAQSHKEVFTVLPVLSLVWLAFVLYITASNRVLSMYLIKLEEQILKIVSQADGEIYMQWVNTIRQFIQKTTGYGPKTLFAYIFVFIFGVFGAVNIWATYEGWAYIVSKGNENGANWYAFGVGLTFVLEVALGYFLITYDVLHRKLSDRLQLEQT